MSDSDSSQKQETSQADNRMVLGQDAIVAQYGAQVSRTNNTNTSIYSTTLDASVANNAISSSRDQSIDNLKQSLTFGTSALNSAMSSSSDALSSALSFGRAALDYNAKGNTQVLDSLDNTTNLVKDAYADAKGRGALTDKILIGAIAMAGLVAFAAVRGKN